MVVNGVLSVLCLMGPTASGKTGLAVSLVERFPFLEIVSVDSVMVYRNLNIGSAKPDRATLTKAPHHLIDVCEPDSIYSAALFREQVLVIMNDIVARGGVPLLVGGAMLYFHALVNGMAPLPAADVEVRSRIAREAHELGWPAMHQRLHAIDPESAKRLKPNDSQRLQRALEVWMLTGKTLTEWHKKQCDTQAGLAEGLVNFKFINVALVPSERCVLHLRIENRFQQMLGAGFVEEVRGLKKRYPMLALSYPSVRSAGYRQVWHYLDGKLDYDSMVDKSLVATRQLAKRQLTWLRSWPNLVQFDCLSSGLLDEVSIFLKRLVLGGAQ